jgi:hypothetical protein
MESNIAKVEHPLETITINHDILTKLQGFQKQFLQNDPSNKEIRKNEFANNSMYLPISFMEMTLDEIFFGLWQTKNFTSRTVANEEVGSLELWYFHPVAQTWLCRVGAAAVMIQYEAEYEGEGKDRKKIKTNITDISKKITNTLTKDYPHLKAECFRNACLSIGKTFGRDLNRKFDDEYNPVIKEVKPQTEEERQVVETKKRIMELSRKIIDNIEKYNGNDKEALKKECAEGIKHNTIKVQRLEIIANKIGVVL